MTTADTGTLYSQISQISFSEFTPSRVTRESTNPYLQEHHYPASLQWKRERPARACHQPLRGRYIQLQFDKRNSVQSSSSSDPGYCSIRRPHSTSSPSALDHIYAQDRLGFTTSTPSDLGKSVPPTLLSPRYCPAFRIDMVDKRTSFAIAVGSNPIHFDDEVRYVNVKENRICRPSSPSTRVANSVENLKQIDEDSDREHYCLSLSPCNDEDSNTKSLNTTPLTAGAHSPTTTASPSPPASRRVSKQQCNNFTSPLAADSSTHSSPIHSQLFTRTDSLEDLTNFETTRKTWRKSSDPMISVNTVAKINSKPRPTFLECKAGEDYGTFQASYMGSREVDCYTNCVDISAKKITNPKSGIKMSDVCVYVSSEKIRLAPPKTGPLFKSFSVVDIQTVSRCSKNNRLVGIVLWKVKSVPVCHVLRCSDQFVADALIEAITKAMESQSCEENECIGTPPDLHQFSLSSEEEDDHSAEQSTSCSASSEDLSLSGIQSLQQSFSVVYIGSVKAGKQQTVNEVIQRGLLERCPSEAKNVTMCLSVNQVRLIDSSFNKGALLARHKANRIKAVEISQSDQKHMGYIVKESSGQLAGHIFQCANIKSVGFIISFLQQACQISYREVQEDSFHPDHYQPDSPSLMARLRSISITQKTIPNHSPSFHSYILGSSPTTAMLDIPKKKRDSVVLNPPQSLVATTTAESPEEDHARFPVTYVGSATLEGSFTPYAITQALDTFNREGIAGGMAAIRKNVISMMVSALGINLTDKTHKLFVHRNYPRKQIVGVAMHPYNSSYFAFATTRPGFPDQLKVHVFSQVATSVNEILEGINFWLQIGNSVTFNS